MQLLPLGELGRVLVGGLEIVPGFDELRAESLHRAVLADVVAVRHDDRRRRGRAAPRQGDALPVIAGRRGDHPAQLRLGAPDRVEIDEPAADLEGADRRVVLVLDPQLGADPRRQQRPAILRGRRHGPMDERRRRLQSSRDRSWPAAAPGEEAVVFEAGLAVASGAPAVVSTRPPAASRIAWPAAVSHSIVVPKRG